MMRSKTSYPCNYLKLAKGKQHKKETKSDLQESNLIPVKVKVAC